jgi:CheY-like chemotaxis protein
LSSGSVGAEDSADDERPDRPPGAQSPVILVVDDERPIANVLAGLVADLGYTPMVASHGRHALELARERAPSLVLTDLMMPYVGGADLAAELRADAEANGRQAPPIILITAAGAAAAETVGADAVLRKPFELDDVEAWVKRLLGPPPGGRSGDTGRGDE